MQMTNQQQALYVQINTPSNVIKDEQCHRISQTLSKQKRKKEQKTNAFLPAASSVALLFYARVLLSSSSPFIQINGAARTL